MGREMSNIPLRKIIESILLITGLAISLPSFTSVMTYSDETDYQSELINQFLGQDAGSSLIEDVVSSSSLASSDTDFLSVRKGSDIWSDFIDGGAIKTVVRSVEIPCGFNNNNNDIECGTLDVQLEEATQIGERDHVNRRQTATSFLRSDRPRAPTPTTISAQFTDSSAKYQEAITVVGVLSAVLTVLISLIWLLWNRQPVETDEMQDIVLPRQLTETQRNVLPAELHQQVVSLKEMIESEITRLQENLDDPPAEKKPFLMKSKWFSNLFKPVSETPNG